MLRTINGEQLAVAQGHACLKSRLSAPLGVLKQAPCIGRLIDPKVCGDIVAFVGSASASVIKWMLYPRRRGLLRTIG